MARGLQIQPYFQRQYIAGGIYGYRWRVEVVAAWGMPAAIFLFRRVATKIYDPATGGAEPPVEIAWAGEFNGVASPVDLEEYPEGAPRTDGSLPPFYRTDVLDQTFRNREVALEAFDVLTQEIKTIIASLDAMDDLEARPAMVFGDPPPPPPP
jgi:hypothetical protein